MRKSCMYIESGIVFLTDSIRFCCLNGTESIIAPLDKPEMDIEHFLSFRDKVLTEPLESCTRCALLRPMPPEAYDRNKKLTLINLAHGDICNFKCDYCYTSRPGFTCAEPKFNISPILTQLHERGLIEENCTFCYASGEPTLNPEFGAFLRFSEKVHGYNFITSNCSIYNDDLARILESGRGEVLCSVDSGTRENFFEVRGVDLFGAVVENLRLYAAKGKTVSKYIVYEPNCRPSEMIRYLKSMRDNGIRHIHFTLNSCGESRPEYIYCAALGKYLALCLGLHVFESDRVLREELINLSALTNEVIAERQEEFFHTLQSEFPDAAEDLSPVIFTTAPSMPVMGYIDSYPHTGAGSGMFRIEGWIADIDSGTVFQAAYVKIGGMYFRTRPLTRPDVAAAYNNPTYAQSGFSALILSRFLSAGVHRAEVIGVSADEKRYAAEHTVEITL